MIFDGHLDLAMNALMLERDLRQPLAAIHEREAGVADGRGVSTVTLPAMRQGGVVLCVATLIARCKPWLSADRVTTRRSLDWPVPAMARATAAGMLDYYLTLERQGEITLIRTQSDLQRVAAVDSSCCDTSPAVGVILTLEGADAVLDPEDLTRWYDAGLRTLMLAHFGKSRYAHGTPSQDASNLHDVDGPLTDEGIALLQAMSELGMPLDLTHLSDTSFQQAIETYQGPVYSSHSGCRSLVDTQRDHTDAQLAVIIERDGVIGLPLCNPFLKDGCKEDDSHDYVSLEDVADHVDHVCQQAGSARHVALGSDLDGGFGVEHVPGGIESIADLPRIGEVLLRRGLTTAEVEDVLGGNWLRFWSRALPHG